LVDLVFGFAFLLFFCCFILLTVLSTKFDAKFYTLDLLLGTAKLAEELIKLLLAGLP